jgi:hypothetical protein
VDAPPHLMIWFFPAQTPPVLCWVCAAARLVPRAKLNDTTRRTPVHRIILTTAKSTRSRKILSQVAMDRINTSTGRKRPVGIPSKA